MPRILDNIEQQLLPALRETLEVAHRADFCVSYFNLRGWKQIDSYIEQWTGGDGYCCRLLVGMQRQLQEELREAMSLVKRDGRIDNQTAQRLKRKLAEEFRDQLTIGAPTNEDETGLRRLAAQIKAKKVVVKLFLRYPLHAKLYLLFRHDPINPIVGYLGSSNLTLAGLSQQGELNIDVLDMERQIQMISMRGSMRQRSSIPSMRLPCPAMVWEIMLPLHPTSRQRKQKPDCSTISLAQARG